MAPTTRLWDRPITGHTIKYAIVSTGRIGIISMYSPNAVMDPLTLSLLPLSQTGYVRVVAHAVYCDAAAIRGRR